MDDTMSSYSFSHQFYQRWTCAPEPIRAAITQELKDITTLLQNDTPFESFVFNTHDLDAHVDELYENHEAEQAIAKAIADKHAQDQAAAEKQRLEEQKRQAVEDDKRKEKAKLEEARLHAETEAAQKKQEQEAQPVREKNNGDEAGAAIDKINADSSTIINSTANNSAAKADSESTSVESSSDNKTISEHANTVGNSSVDSTHNDKNIKNDHSITAINAKASAAISLAVKDAKLSATHQELIRELEMQIDDYLSDQMMLMSENLKSWLRAEMTQHLNEKNASAANEEVTKKNSH
ncbi:cell envelope integrity protein TolA [Psychrobacter vallis]|uniref:cell envelope integrity protein TolA n=1 Tax=Psychrobacter vallis TaxID=248451 RepID=UPI001919DA5D|nr:cell envelope integrity protein TolA [Psychrobacter vallis]